MNILDIVLVIGGIYIGQEYNNLPNIKDTVVYVYNIIIRKLK